MEYEKGYVYRLMDQGGPTDLYDGGGKNAIPFDKLDAFYKEYLR